MRAKNFRPLTQRMCDARNVWQFRELMGCSSIQLDANLIHRASNKIAARMTRLIAYKIGEGLPSSSFHFLNGFGIFNRGSQTALDVFSSFCTNGSGGPAIIQAPTLDKGDLHPWQGFAYATMAGITPEEEIPNTGASIRTVAINSRAITLSQYGDQEFGHLLLAASYLVPDSEFPFVVDGSKITLKGLIERAFEAHITLLEQQQIVCGGFHLTEGLCAAGAKIPGLSSIKEEAQELLKRQLDTLTHFRYILEETNVVNNPKIKEAAVHLIGHALETAAFAILWGYEITKEQKNTIAYVVNLINKKLLNEWLKISDDTFYHLCHYRRAITLLAAIEEATKRGAPVDSVDLAEYSFNFNLL